MTHPTTTPPQRNGKKLPTIVVLQILLVVMMPIVGWTSAQIIDHSTRLTRIETDRSWLMDRIDRLDMSFDKMDGKMDQILKEMRK